MLYRRSLLSSLKTPGSRNILGNCFSIIPIFKRSIKTTAFNNSPISLLNRTNLITANKQLLRLNQIRYNSSANNNGDELPKHYNSDGQRELSKEECVELLNSLKQIWSSEEFQKGSIVDFDTEVVQSKYRQLFQKYEMQGMNSVSFGNMMNTILTDEDSAIKPGDKVKNVQLFHKAVMEYHLYKQENLGKESRQETPDFMSANSNRNTYKNEGNQQSNKNAGGSKNNLQPPPLRFDVLLLWLSSGLLVYLLFSIESNEREITWQDCCTSLLDKGYVEKLIVVNNNVVRVIMNDYGKNQPVHSSKVEYYFTIGSVLKFEENLKRYQEEKNITDDLKVPVIYVQSVSVMKSVYSILPTLLLFGFIFYAGRSMLKSTGGMGGGGGLFGPPSSKIIKKFNSESQVNIKFADVAGCDEAKEEVMEFVKFLKNPKKYEKLGAKIPRGAILSGPPGTGKTLLAKATAGEADVPFYSVSGSEFVEMFVGVGASRVRELFKVARENAPSIIFVDEIDAIGKSRSKGKGAGSNDERENTLNQLLVEMDGFSTKDHVVVLAGTNRADVLDSALTRPGRFDRKIYLDNPELEGRKDIFNVHLKKIKLAEECDLEDLKGRLATLTPGFSGADIANVCNEAALIAARHNKEAVSLTDFEQAIERVVAGLEKKSKLLSFEEKKVVAYHEAGHAICGWFLEFADPLLKVSIIPRGQGALGYAQYLPPDIYLYSTKKLLDRMTMTLGGRVSEELHFDSVTSGGSDDFEKVTNLAQRMVLECGMSPKVGLVNYNMDRGNDMTKPFSDKTSSLIDSEIHRLVAESYERCKNLLIEKKDELELVAQELLSKEVITREDMIRLLGKRPFPNRNDAFDLYLADQAERSQKKKVEGNEEDNDAEKKEDEGEVKKDE